MINRYPYTDAHELNLDWCLRKIKECVEMVEDFNTWKEEHEQQYLELKSLYDAVMSGNFPETITTAFYSWMRENANSLVGEMVKNVFFGLTDEGYFVAYIPNSWRDIIFNTTGYDIIVPLQNQYGHLVLSY